MISANLCVDISREDIGSARVQNWGFPSTSRLVLTTAPLTFSCDGANVHVKEEIINNELYRKEQA